MTDTFTPPQRLPVWSSLEQHAARLRATRVRTLFDTDAGRFQRLSRSVCGLTVDFSKQRLDAAALADLLELASAAGLQDGIAGLFGAAQMNFTEGRAALHMALRGSCPAPGGEDVTRYFREARSFARALREGGIKGATGKSINHVINLGIGGSDLGPRMVFEALAHTHRPVKVDFVANIDPRDLDEALAGVDPERTLFIVSSKSFGTAETLSNATAARAWLASTLPARVADNALAVHFAAVSNATASAAAFGIPPERVFPLPEWVGGRYSVWSAIGLPLLIAFGEAGFDAFLAGGRDLDQHFLKAPLADNLPVLMGLVGLWNTDFLGLETLAVLPYAHGLRNFAMWLQQLEMESNGKRTLRNGEASAVQTSPVVWGGVGTVGQHAFHQLFYQGTRTIPMDFIVPVGDDDPRQRGLVDNAFAQAAALMNGRDLATATAALAAKGMTPDEVERLAPHLVCPGNQPSTTILLPQLDAYHLGALLALYEHKVFVQGWIWGINSFDQYGVELGKEMARALAQGGSAECDASTAGLMAAAAAIRASNRAR
nr:glucose-6-phosphate isomerase [Azoarcus olearius]